MMDQYSFSHSSIPLKQKKYVIFKKLHKDAIIPTKATPLSAGFDLYALEDTFIERNLGNFLVKTGISVTLPEGTYGRIAIRSGLALREHLNVSAGVIDRDYKGEIGVIVFTSKHNPFNDASTYGYVIKKGERFAQIIPEKILECESKINEDEENEDNAHEGWGSTGKF